MTDEQARYHSVRFFHTRIEGHFKLNPDLDSEFEVDRDLRVYQYENRDLYEFNKQDAYERQEIIDYLRRNGYAVFTEKRIITNYYILGQKGKDIITGKEELFY